MPIGTWHLGILCRAEPAGMPGGSSSGSISREAALTILLHAAKFPAAAVNGVLLGTVEPGSGAVAIRAAVPLLHTFLTLAPSLETALFLVRHGLPVPVQDRRSATRARVWPNTSCGCRSTRTAALARRAWACWVCTMQMPAWATRTWALQRASSQSGYSSRAALGGQCWCAQARRHG